MAMICDNAHFYNRFSAHDAISEACARWADHYNFMASLPWLSDADRNQFEYEMSEYICYDV
jgi:hypothetical protein